jgi:hypothetical protein
MSVFDGRSFMNWIRERRGGGLQHILQAAYNGHDEPPYMFGILTVEYNNLPVEVKEALVHLDKFIMPSLVDLMI